MQEPTTVASQRRIQLLGEIHAAGRTIAVSWVEESTALWLTTIGDTADQPLGVIRWTLLQTAVLSLAPGTDHWLMPHSRLARRVVNLATALYRLRVLGELPRGVAQVIPTTATVTF